MPGIQRHLRAIMFSDMTGYSRMMGKDEETTLALVEEMTGLMTSTIKEHRGNVLKFIGDAVLATFDSASDAVFCAIAVQRMLAERNRDKPTETQIRIRIGIHIGDIVLKEGDVFGDGVNIAARLEPLAKPGGICVSQAVYDMVKAQPEFRTLALGSRKLKNIREEVTIYHVLTGMEDHRPSVLMTRLRASKYRLPLGMISILALAAAGWLGWRQIEERRSASHNGFTIAVARFLATSQQGKDQAIIQRGLIMQKLDTELREEKGVRILSDGIVDIPSTQAEAEALGKKLGANVVIWGRVIALDKDTMFSPYITLIQSDANIPEDESQAFQSSLGVPDQLKLRQEKANELGNLALLVASKYYRRKGSPDKALSILQKINPPNEISLTEQAFILYGEKRWKEMEIVLNRAAALNPKNVVPRQMLALGHYLLGDPERAIRELESIKKENPRSSKTYQLLGMINMEEGRLTEAAQYAKKAMDLNPDDKYVYSNLGQIYYEQGKYDQASEVYLTLTQKSSSNLYANLLYYLSLRRSGEASKADAYLQKLVETLRPLRLDANSSWPAAIAYFFAGKISADDLMKFMSSGDPGNRLKRQMKGYFYLGMAHLLDDKETDHIQRARDCFKKCLSTGLKHYSEYSLAQFELSKIK